MYVVFNYRPTDNKKFNILPLGRVVGAPTKIPSLVNGGGLLPGCTPRPGLRENGCPGAPRLRKFSTQIQLQEVVGGGSCEVGLIPQNTVLDVYCIGTLLTKVSYTNPITIQNVRFEWKKKLLNNTV